MQCSESCAGVGFRVRLAQRELEYSMKTDEFEIPPMECRARRSRAVFKISTAFTRHAGKFAAADLDHESCWESSFWCRDECLRGLRGGRGGCMALVLRSGFVYV